MITHTPHERVAACCDHCARCGHQARLIIQPGNNLLECGNPKCRNTVHHPELAEAMRLWNLQQREHNNRGLT